MPFQSTSFSNKASLGLACSITLIGCLLSGCGSSDSGSDDPADGGGSSTVTSIVASGITLPLHGSVNGKDYWPRNAGPDSIVQGVDTTTNTTFFAGKFRVQRLLGSQSTTIAPPQKLTFRFVDATSGAFYFRETVSRGTFESGLDVWGNSASGTWPYSVYASMGYRMAAGTVVRAYLVDDGDGVANSGDEWSGIQLWQGTQFLPSTWTETQPLSVPTRPADQSHGRVPSIELLALPPSRWPFLCCCVASPAVTDCLPRSIPCRIPTTTSPSTTSVAMSRSRKEPS
jgi:hypothetical protein